MSSTAPLAVERSPGWAAGHVLPTRAGTFPVLV